MTTQDRKSGFFPDHELEEFIADKYGTMMSSAVYRILKEDPEGSTRFATAVRRSITREMLDNDRS